MACTWQSVITSYSNLKITGIVRHKVVCFCYDKGNSKIAQSSWMVFLMFSLVFYHQYNGARLKRVSSMCWFPSIRNEQSDNEWRLLRSVHMSVVFPTMKLFTNACFTSSTSFFDGTCKFVCSSLYSVSCRKHCCSINFAMLSSNIY